MRVMRQGYLIGAVSAVAIGCGGDSSGPSTESLAGSWRATKVEISSVANPTVKVDLVAQGGTVRLVLTEAKTFTLTVAIPGQPDDVTTGTWSSSVDVMTLQYPSGSWQFEMTLSGSSLILEGADSEFDFNGDDQDEPAKTNLVLTRE
jgi:hypothetical protein